MANYLYDRYGRIYRKVADLPDGKVLVNQQQAIVYEDGDEPEFEDWTLVIVKPEALHETPPKVAVTRDIQVLQDQFAEAREQLNDIKKQTRDAEKEHTEVLNRLAKFPPLAKLDAFLNGRIRYVIQRNWGLPAVYDLNDEKCVEALKEREDYKRGLKLITLKGEVSPSTGSVRWTINDDLSALVETEAEMPETLLSFVTACVKENRLHGLGALVEKWNVPISDMQREVIANYEARQNAEGEQRRKREIDRLKNELAKLGGQA